MLESGVNDGIGCGCSAAKAFQVLQIPSMRLGAGGLKRFCSRIGPRHSKQVMACADEFFYDGGTDESGSASNEYAHMCPLDLIGARLTKGCGLD